MRVTAYRFAQRPTLPNCDLIPFLHSKSRADMRSQVLVSLLIPGVFGDKVEIFSADNEGAVHFGGDDGARQNTTADADFAGERAFFV